MAEGYELRIREPEWYDHRMFHSARKSVHLHVFSCGCPEAQNMLNFRNWLRLNEEDRLKYEQTKQSLAAKNWQIVQEYADAKTTVIMEIRKRANEYFENL